MLHGRLCQDERVDEASASPVGYRLLVAALDCIGPARGGAHRYAGACATAVAGRAPQLARRPGAAGALRPVRPAPAATVRGQRRTGEQPGAGAAPGPYLAHFSDQASLEHALQSGEIDFAPGLTQTPASLRMWLFSDPYMRVPQLVVSDQKAAARSIWKSSTARPASPCACRAALPTICAATIRT